MCVLVTQSCPTLCDPTDCSLPDSSVHGILQARILDYWGAIPFSRDLPDPVSPILNSSLLYCRLIFFFNHLSHQESPEVSTVCHKTYPFLLLPSVPGSTACQPTHPTTWKTIFCGDHVYTFWAWTSWIYILTLAFISCLTLGNLTTVASISSFMKWITALIFVDQMH